MMDTTSNDLHHYLCNARGAVSWKLQGLSDYDARRPMVGTGTNLLGLVKHLTGVELLYFGVIFERFPDALPDWFGEQMAPNADMWAAADEPGARILADYHAACHHADETIRSLSPDTMVKVPWVAEQPMSLHRILVHVLAETERHAGHADVVRELIDGSVGRLPGNAQMLPGADVDTRDRAWWDQYRSLVDDAARDASREEDPGTR